MHPGVCFFFSEEKGVYEKQFCLLMLDMLLKIVLYFQSRRVCKLDKADILEMTVAYVNKVNHAGMFTSGFT